MLTRRWLPLLLILLPALVLRLINLGGRSLWYDEAFAVLFAEKGLSAMLAGTLTPVAGGAADIHPLLYYSTLNMWMTFWGQSAFAVRLWSVMLGVATVAMIFILSRALFSERTGLAAALITAVVPFHVQYSQETRMYSLLCLLLVAATWCFVKGWRSRESLRSWRGTRWWLGFGVLAGLAMYTQQLAAFYLIALGLIPLLSRQWRQFGRVIFGAIVAVTVYLPWLVNVPSQFQKVRSYYWLEPPNLVRPIRTAASFLMVNLDVPNPALTIGLLGSVFLLLFLVIQVVIFLRGRRTRSSRTPLLLVLWLAVIPPALMWLISQIQPIYLERSLIPSALMLYIALAWLFTQSGIPRPIAGVLGALGLVLVGIGLYYQYTWATFPNSPFQLVGDHIRQEWQLGDVIVHQNKLTALPMIYYERNLQQRFIGDKPGSSSDTLALPTQQALNILADACVQSAAQAANRVWWVVFDFAEEQYASQNRPEYQQAVDWLEAHYTRASIQKFNDLDVVLYTDPRGDLSTNCD